MKEVDLEKTMCCVILTMTLWERQRKVTGWQGGVDGWSGAEGREPTVM